MTRAERQERARALVRAWKITAEEACRRKVAFPTQNDARHAAKAVAKRRERAVDTYACPFCHAWHITVLKHGEEAA